MLFYTILFTSFFIAASSVTVYGIIDRWYWPWIALLIFLNVFILCVLIHLVCCTFLSFFVNINKPIHRQSRFFYRILTQTAYLFLRIMHVRVHFSGKEYLPKDSRFLLVCNHISWIDPAVTMVLFKKYHIAFISRKENYSYPIANKFLYKAACLALDRENNREALKTINKAAEFLNDGTCAIGIYPEGWVTKTGELQEFRHGAFRIAKKACAPVLVTHISGADKVFNKPFWKKCDVFFEIKGVIPEEFVREHKTVEISDLAREIMMKQKMGG